MPAATILLDESTQPVRPLPQMYQVTAPEAYLAACRITRLLETGSLPGDPPKSAVLVRVQLKTLTGFTAVTALYPADPSRV